MKYKEERTWRRSIIEYTKYTNACSVSAARRGVLVLMRVAQREHRPRDVLALLEAESAHAFRALPVEGLEVVERRLGERRPHLLGRHERHVDRVAVGRVGAARHEDVVQVARAWLARDLAGRAARLEAVGRPPPPRSAARGRATR